MAMIETVQTCASLGWPDVVIRLGLLALVAFIVWLLMQPASVDAYVGAREDAAIWKKRALEAEELNRKFIADVNGPTYLGEPVKQEQPAERDGIPEWTPAIGIECAILNLNDNAMRLRHGSHAPLQIADDLDVIATSLAGCLPVAQQGAQS